MSWFDKFRFGSFNKWFGFRWGPTPEYNDFTAQRAKLDIIFKNPALLKVFALQCDLFSLGRITVLDKEGNEIENDPALERFRNPNPYQSQAQFLWDYMFWTMVGTSYCYVDSDNPLNPNNKLYFLDISKLFFPTEMEFEVDKLIFSNAKVNEIKGKMMKYKYKDGNEYKFPLEKLVINYDLTNGTGNWYKSNSRIDALCKIISNSEYSLDAKNINVRYAGKFMVSGQQDPSDVTKTPLSRQEKISIEEQVNGDKVVHGVKSAIQIQRFVSDMGALRLDEAYLADYFLIGNMYNIPRDVLEAYQSSTYENQEKARASHVSYTLDPKGTAFFHELAKKWGYVEQGKVINIDWNHLPFMQVFEKERAQVNEIKAKTFVTLINAGVALEEINELLGLNFKTGEKAQQTETNPEPEEEAGAGESEQGETANQQGA